MPLNTFQTILTSNDPVGSSFMDSSAGTTYLVTELQDIKSVVRGQSLQKTWISVLGLQGPWTGGLGWTQLSGTQASIQGDQSVATGTGYLIVGQRVRAFVTAGTIKGQVTAVTVGAGVTTVTFVWDGAGALDSGLSDIQTAGDPSGIPNSVETQTQAPLYAVITNGGSGSVFTGALTPAITAYVTGQAYRVKWTQASQGADTINLNTIGAVAVKKNVTDALAAGDVPAGAITILLYDGTNFQLISTGRVSAAVVKPSDQSVTSSTTLTNDTALLFPLLANEVWEFECDLYTTESAAGGLDLAVTSPAASSLFYSAVPVGIGAGGVTSKGAVASGTRLGMSAGGTSPTTILVRVRGVVNNGANVGNLQLQFSQDVSDGTATIMKANSTLIARRIS